jgi:pantetheine-phosphate adenylyltransferase
VIPTKRIAVYAASFDPPTYGHIHCILKGARMFDQLIVAIGVNPDKKYTFTLQERLDMLNSWVKEIAKPNISVSSYESQYLYDYALDVKADYILRGVRNINDFEYEKTLSEFNEEHCAGLTTVFIIPTPRVAKISSSFVKGLVRYKGWEHILSDYVPENVRQALIKKFNGEFC